jgi:hypothetical protein
MDALGRLFDIGTGWTPVDLDTSNGATGKRIALSGANAITFVVFCGAGADGAVLTLDVQQHTAYTGGTSNDLDAAAVTGSTGVTYYYLKGETTLDNDEPWTKVTQAEASEIALVAGDSDTEQIIVIEVEASQLAEGYTHVSLNASATLSAARLSSCLYFLHELRYQRKPQNLRNLLRPSAVNA